MYVACRDIILKNVFGSVEEGLSVLGINSIELYLPRDFKVFSGHNLEYELSSFKKYLSEQNIEVNSILIANDFMETDYVVKAVNIAHRLGLGVVRVDTIVKEVEGYSLEDCIRASIDWLKELKDKVKDVVLAIENHGYVSNREEYLDALFKEFPETFLGLTLDTGNFYWYGYPLSKVYEIVKKFADRVKHTHVKNAVAERKEAWRKPGDVTMSPLFEGDVDLKKIVNILKRHGYNGDLTIEDESLGRCSDLEKKDILIRDTKYLNNLCRL